MLDKLGPLKITDDMNIALTDDILLSDDQCDSTFNTVLPEVHYDSNDDSSGNLHDATIACTTALFDLHDPTTTRPSLVSETISSVITPSMTGSKDVVEAKMISPQTHSHRAEAGVEEQHLKPPSSGGCLPDGGFEVVLLSSGKSGGAVSDGGFKVVLSAPDDGSTVVLDPPIAQTGSVPLQSLNVEVEVLAGSSKPAEIKTPVKSKTAVTFAPSAKTKRARMVDELDQMLAWEKLMAQPPPPTTPSLPQRWAAFEKRYTRRGKIQVVQDESHAMWIAEKLIVHVPTAACQPISRS